MYPEHNQLDPDNPDCRESSQHIPPTQTQSMDGPKLFSERLYLAYNRNYDIPVCVARYHNIFGQKEHGMEEKKRPSSYLPQGRTTPRSGRND